MSRYTHSLALSDARHNKHTERGRSGRRGGVEVGGGLLGKMKSGYEEERRGEGEVEVRTERGRVKLGGRELMGGLEGCGRRRTDDKG